MTENDIKEQISLAFIDAIRSYNGYNTSYSKNDYGIDFTLRRVIRRNEGDSYRFYQTGEAIDFQLKCTTQDKVLSSKANHIDYSLRFANYKDLIIRREESTIPLILIVFILPQNTEEWVTVSESNLLIQKNAYWFRPRAGTQIPTKGKNSKVKISIPKRNLISRNSFNILFNKFY